MSFDLEGALAKFSFGTTARLRFYELTRNFVADGIPIYEALRDIDKESRKIRFFPPRIIEDILTSMRGKKNQSPKSLGEAMRPWVDPVEATLIESGEQSAKLEVGLAEAASLIQVKARMNATIYSNMAYPGFLVLLLAGFLWLVSSEIIPVMQEILPRKKWPLIGQVLGSITDHSTLIVSLMLISIASLAVVFNVSAPKWTGRGREFFDRWVPPWSVYKKVQSAMVLNALAMLMHAGVPVSSAISQMGAIGSPWQRMHMNRIQMRMRRGMGEADAIAGVENDSMFDPVTAWEIRMYGNRTRFAEQLKGLSLRSTTRVEKTIELSFVIARNFLLVLVAGMLGMSFSSFLQITMAVSSRGNM